MKIVLEDHEGNNLHDLLFQEYCITYPNPTAEYGHRDYFVIYNAKYTTDPQIYDKEVLNLIKSLEFSDWEEDVEGLFSFEWKNLKEREKIFNTLKSLT